MSEEQTTQSILTKKTVMVPIPFFFTLAANTQQTLVSNAITVNYKIKSVEAHFRDDAAHNLLFYILSGNNQSTSTTIVPPDMNVVSSLSPTPYLTGEGEIIELAVNYEPAENYMYVKVHAVNNNAYAITGLCVVTIEGYLKVKADSENIIPITNEQLEKAGEFQTDQLAKVKVILDSATSALKGTPQLIGSSWVDFEQEQKKETTGLYEQYLDAAAITGVIPPDMPLEDRHKPTKAWLDRLFSLTFETMNNDGLIRMLVSAFGGSVVEWAKWFENVFGFESHINKLLSIGIEKAAFRPVEYYWNRLYTPEIPSTSDLINMVVKEVISLDTFADLMKYQGISAEWSGKIWDAHFIAPNFEQAKMALWRGGISMQDFPNFLKLVDLDPKYNEQVWFKLLENIPPYSDLINMRVKEVLTQEDFSAHMLKNGYSGYWSGKLWDAHFTPPTFGDFLLTMYRKRTVTIPKADGTTEQYTFGSNFNEDMTKINELSILADYDPRYWSFFKERAITDPTPREARWGYESGSISREELVDIVSRRGMTTKDTSWYSEMLATFQERPLITRYINALMTGYIKGVISADTLKDRVIAIPRRVEVAEWIIKIADVQKEVEDKQVIATKERLLTVGEIKTLYMKDLITNLDFNTRLQVLGYETIDIELMKELIDIMKEEKESGAKKSSLSVSEYFNAYKFYQVTEDQVRTNLMLRGLNLDEANLLIETKKAEWKSKGWTETQEAM